MFRFLYFTDTHHTAKNPVSRKDILYETCIKKIKEIIELGKELNVDGYLHGGDFFDSPDISDGVASDIGKLYQEFSHPVIVIPGNHDIKGNNIKTLSQTKLGLLGNLGVVQILNYGDLISFEKKGLTVQVTGSPSDFGINKNKEKFVLKEKKADIAIHMAHAMILKESLDFGDYVPLSEIQDETVADITLSGDFHLGFDTVEYNEKYFVNPGALVRKYNFVEEINRIPQVSLITINDDKSIKIEMVPLKCAQEGTEVLDREKLTNQVEYSKKLQNFKKQIKLKEKNDLDSLNDIILLLQKQRKIEQEVIDETFIRLDDARKKLNG